MVDRGFGEDELIIDWDHLLSNLPDDLNFDFCSQPAAHGFPPSPNSGCSLSIDDIEQYLMNDPEEKDQNILADEFKESGSGSDRSKESSTSPESVEVGTDEECREKEEDSSRQNVEDVPQTKENTIVDVVDDDSNDPIAKKRKRQMRNRDAAVRSRERKKMHVRDLEMKSKYYEAECKRLGFLLQCCAAENQALRLSLHNNTAFDASMTKQESAVLLLESLLLGSLLGFLGIIYLLILPSQLLSTLDAALPENAASPEWESAAPRKAGSNVFRVVFHSFKMGKRCKASRSRMKLSLSNTEVSLMT